MGAGDFLFDEQFTSALRKVSQTKEGHIVLKKILNVCRLDEHGFVPGDQYATAFKCGQRSIGLWLKSEMEAGERGERYGGKN